MDTHFSSHQTWKCKKAPFQEECVFSTVCSLGRGRFKGDRSGDLQGFCVFFATHLEVATKATTLRPCLVFFLRSGGWGVEGCAKTSSRSSARTFTTHLAVCSIVFFCEAPSTNMAPRINTKTNICVPPALPKQTSHTPGRKRTKTRAHACCFVFLFFRGGAPKFVFHRSGRWFDIELEAPSTTPTRKKEAERKTHAYVVSSVCFFLYFFSFFEAPSTTPTPKKHASACVFSSYLFPVSFLFLA